MLPLSISLSLSNTFQAYCEEDYYNMFAPRCGACSKPVMGTCVSALGKQWHPECFVCTTCKLAFTEQVCACACLLVVALPESLCMRGACQGHPGFFVRITCKLAFTEQVRACVRVCLLLVVVLVNTCTSLYPCPRQRDAPNAHANATYSDARTHAHAHPNQQYYDHGGRPYCEVHFHAMQGTLCQTCQKPITGRCVTAAGNRRYHPEHFVCAFCKRQLMNTTYKETGAKFFCSPCHIKLFE